MSTTGANGRRATVGDRFRKLLATWLATLPKAGWRGGTGELFDALETLNVGGKFFTIVTRGSALTKLLALHDGTFAEAGFACRAGRTQSTRFLAVEPVRVRKPAPVTPDAKALLAEIDRAIDDAESVLAEVAPLANDNPLTPANDTTPSMENAP